MYTAGMRFKVLLSLGIITICAAHPLVAWESQAATPTLPLPTPVSAQEQTKQLNILYSQVNQLRRKHHLPQLKVNRSLANGARAYSQKMVRVHFFSHTEPGGGTLERRVVRSGYVPKGWIWAAGENLVWMGSQAQPGQHAFQMWLHSPHHLENMLIREWVHMGAGWVPGNPWGNLGSTWTIWFGERFR